MESDLRLAFRLADIADVTTMRYWSPTGVVAATKVDGSPVTEADVAAEHAVRDLLRQARPGDGFLGEEIDEVCGTTRCRWIVDGIDGTRFFAAGQRTWGTLIALERDGEIVLGLSSSPAQERRWWATRGGGTFSGWPTTSSASTRVQVSNAGHGMRLVTLPGFDRLTAAEQRVVKTLAGGPTTDLPWSHQVRVAEGELDACVWFGGDIRDHAAPSILVEEAGGRFTDHSGEKRLDTRTAIYSNAAVHAEILAALAELMPRPDVPPRALPAGSELSSQVGEHAIEEPGI